MLAKIQNGSSAKILNNNSLNLSRVSAILLQIQNGAFVYHNELG